MLGEELPFAIDITEIDGFDDLHHAGGILKDAQERAARVYHAGETHFLINGSSVGIRVPCHRDVWIEPGIFNAGLRFVLTVEYRSFCRGCPDGFEERAGDPYGRDRITDL